MEANEMIKPGDFLEDFFIVDEQHTASQIGSGSLRVLATPVMIGMMEKASHRLLANTLPEGSSSVGVLVEVRHLAPSPLGSRIRVHSQVMAVDGRTVTFRVQAWDDQEQVGDGTHQRMVIDVARFLKRVAAKSGQSV